MSLLDVVDKTIFRFRIAFFSFVKCNDTILGFKPLQSKYIYKKITQKPTHSNRCVYYHGIYTDLFICCLPAPS